jgi:uncharacterized protein
MRDGFRIVDMDRHVMEPVSLWPDYLPAWMRDEVPRLVPWIPEGETLESRLERLGDQALLPVPHVLTVGGKPLMRGVSEAAYIEIGLAAARRRDALRDAESACGHLAEMDRSGVDVAVLIPTFAWYLVYDDEIDAKRSRAYAQAYNRWLRDLCAAAPARLLGAALVSCHEPEAMVADLERAIGEGFTAVLLRPNPVLGRTLGAPAYTPFWRACAHHSVPVLLHEGCHTRVSTTGADRFESHFGQHACSHPLEAMMALLSLIDGGVLEAHPALRVGFLESGCGWLPYWLWRLDEVEYAMMAQEVRARVRRRPSEYFRRQCWIAIEPGEAMLDRAATEIGPGRLLFGTDFPHLEHGPGIVDELFSRRSALGDEALRAILWDSPSRLMGMDPGEGGGVGRDA